MGSGAAKPAVSKKDTEVLETHGNEEATSGFIFPLINIHINCALGTILFAFCFLVCVLLCYLEQHSTATATPMRTCSSCPSSTSLRPAWDKETMEDRYYASMQRQSMRYEDEDFDFDFAHPLPQRYEQPRQLAPLQQGLDCGLHRS
jgi:hypothetical protein